MELDRNRLTPGDILAGVSVAFVAIPQSLAYAEIAGMPAYTGLYATAFPALLAAFFAHSRYLQTGPVATTSLLAFGALTPLAAAKTPEYIGLAALLALLVGVFRLLLGVFRLGRIADYMSHAVLLGFSTAAAFLIVSSQADKIVGITDAPDGLFEKLLHVLSHPGSWDPVALIVAAAAVGLILVGRRVHALFPGVLVTAIVGVLLGRFWDYPAAMIGSIPSGLPDFSLAFQWSSTGSLVVSAAVIAVLGFAEPTAISRTLAAQDRERWDANRELVSQGVANIASSLAGGFPVGGSFSRSSVNKLAGARTRWAGAVTGVTIIAFLPFADLLSTLPQAVLGAIVVVAIAKFFRIGEMLRLFPLSVPQAVVAWGTFVATILLAPRVEYGILIGVGLALGVHVLREASLVSVESEYEDGVVTLRPTGVLFFASASRFQDELLETLAAHSDATGLHLDLRQLGRVDYTGAVTLADVIREAQSTNLKVSVLNASPRVRDLLAALQ